MPSDVDSKQDMKADRVVPPEQQVAWEVFVFWVLLHDLVARERADDRVARDEPLPHTHVDVIRPQSVPLSETLADECKWIIGKNSRCHSPCIAQRRPEV